MATIFRVLLGITYQCPTIHNIVSIFTVSSFNPNIPIYKAGPKTSVRSRVKWGPCKWPKTYG